MAGGSLSRRRWLFHVGGAAAAGLFHPAFSATTTQRLDGAVDRVTIDGSLVVHWQRTADAGATVTVDGNDADRIAVSLLSGTLRIVDQRPLPRTDRVAVDVRTATPREIQYRGAGVLRCESLEGESLALHGSGSLAIQASGRVGTVVVDLDGAVSAQMRELEAQVMKVSLRGASSAHVHVRSELDAAIFGTGSVRYRGTPTVHRKIMGLGSVQPE